MIQVILKDGIKKRFTKEIIGINKKDIIFQKVLSEKEIEKIPVKKKDKWVFQKPTPPPMDFEKIKEEIIFFQMQIDAGKKHNFDMSTYETKLKELKNKLENKGA